MYSGKRAMGIGRFREVGVAIPLQLHKKIFRDVFDFYMAKKIKKFYEYIKCCLALVYLKPYDSYFIKFTPPPPASVLKLNLTSASVFARRCNEYMSGSKIYF